jgi:hypothetical protein
VSRNEWPFHVREYTPRQFENLFAPYGKLRIFAGDSKGDMRQETKSKALYYFINDLYCRPATVWLAKIVKRIMFTRVWPHQAAIVYTGTEAYSSRIQTQARAVWLRPSAGNRRRHQKGGRAVRRPQED